MQPGADVLGPRVLVRRHGGERVARHGAPRVRVAAHRALLLGGSGDLRVHFLDDRHRADNRRECIACITAQVDAVVSQGAAAVHDIGHLLGAGVQSEYQPFDLFSGCLRA